MSEEAYEAADRLKLEISEVRGTAYVIRDMRQYPENFHKGMGDDRQRQQKLRALLKSPTIRSHLVGYTPVAIRRALKWRLGIGRASNRRNNMRQYQGSGGSAQSDNDFSRRVIRDNAGQTVKNLGNFGKVTTVFIGLSGVDILMRCRRDATTREKIRDASMRWSIHRLIVAFSLL